MEGGGSRVHTDDLPYCVILLSCFVFRASQQMPVLSCKTSQVATVLDQFHKFLGPELKAVTGESAGIDDIMDRVDGLALPLNKASSMNSMSSMSSITIFSATYIYCRRDTGPACFHWSRVRESPYLLFYCSNWYYTWYCTSK